ELREESPQEIAETLLENTRTLFQL
ncbi:hypothetical protein, partial [Erwinia billingiae]